MLKKFSLLLMPLLLVGCTKNPSSIKYHYGVFLSCEPKDSSAMRAYQEIVIDAQYFSSDDIKYLKGYGSRVYSYINVGALENFRDYYDTYKDITLGDYENWDEERWVDVSKPNWQSFISDLAKDILSKDIDGLFVDNIDVYYNYKTEAIFDGVTSILKDLKKQDTYVIINGGDTYVSEYIDRYHSLDGVMDAVNQETIFSKINWDTNTFLKNDEEETKYFKEYVETVSSYKKDVYLLEYSKDKSIIETTKEYCKKNNFKYYVSETLELKIPSSYKGSQEL